MARRAAVVAFVTCPDRRSARRVADGLIARRAAACVNILPGVTSVYRWQGKVERSAEHLLIIKTTAAGFSALRRAVLALHPYDVPEIIALPVTQGHRPYLDWVYQSLSDST